MQTILVADDEDFLRLLVKETLRQYRVIEARDGDEALVLAREAEPDLLILDWMMPGRHGPAVSPSCAPTRPRATFRADDDGARRRGGARPAARSRRHRVHGEAVRYRALRAAVEEIIGKPAA
jgi:CheY-like chemotaxis protein